MNKLVNNVTENEPDHWTDLKDGDYLFLKNSTDQLCAIVFKCPGCGTTIHVSNNSEHPAKWDIDFSTLTVSPSIRHRRERNDGSFSGCGWHGYLKNGELEGQIE